jgi:hypothetical protein
MRGSLVESLMEQNGMNLTRKRLEAIRIALDYFIIELDDLHTRAVADNLRGTVITAEDADEARKWVAERIEKLDTGKWY